MITRKERCVVVVSHQQQLFPPIKPTFFFTNITNKKWKHHLAYISCTRKFWGLKSFFIVCFFSGENEGLNGLILCVGRSHSLFWNAPFQLKVANFEEECEASVESVCVYKTTGGQVTWPPWHRTPPKKKRRKKRKKYSSKQLGSCRMR